MSGQARISVDLMEQEVGSLLFLLGGMGAKHLVLVGGLVPPMLVPTPSAPHIGTTDIDLCLSVALTGGATREYYRSIEAKIDDYFVPSDGTSFRWRKREGVAGVPLVVDFLAPESSADGLLVDGTRELIEPVAGSNAGSRLRPLAMRAGEVMQIDSVPRSLTVDYLYGDGRVPVAIQHTGPVGLLAAKAEALNGRSEHKDGYDVAWYCIHAAPTADEVADLISERPAFANELIPESIQILRTAFGERDFPGPVGYASLAFPDSPPGSETYERACNEAALTVSNVMELLRRRIPWNP